MNRNQKLISVLILGIVVVFVLVVNTQRPTSSEFPDFFTKNKDYFVTRIGSIPTIDRDTYRLEITGLIDNPTSYSLDELQAMDLTELPLTVECIGNDKDGSLVGTAVWTGFLLYDLLETLGLSENATGVNQRLKMTHNSCKFCPLLVENICQ